ncbi:SusC/RagA family TonB-linked outer membrane protein [Pedobacter africanus]|uniref:TonB-linked outer membrane protein, SusC/RagA family n=1 Tax=Pedobacter africanus TaxID=151894 RepID=A0A1W2AXD4_9SPHI|nr:SusC/RagA family TonB-linked outer membrane protein [Pedobacter africanus]SMC64838.1 TonB-linked outer membrane protein, SusC/RagA family [Pedobacter africanus]
MNFYMTFKHCLKGSVYANISLKLKLTFIILTTVILQVSAASYAQITLKEKGAPLERIIQSIRKQTGYDFFYNANMLSKADPVTINVKNASVKEVLDLCFAGQSLSYRIEQNTIIVQNARPLLTRAIVFLGKVVDKNNKPIGGASIRIKGSDTRAVATGQDGTFRIVLQSEKDVLQISYIGFKTQEVKYLPGFPAGSYRIIVMEDDEKLMNEFVVTGTGITRNKNSFTGATATFSGDQLKSIGNNNLIQSLRTLDPSFIQMENNLAGANPNVLPNIEVRGKTSVPIATLRDQFGADPNQPLFILDGFETTLQNIVDLDINRIGSVTILKDAASTALYGARASNGVIVVETIKPKPGKLQFSYSNDFRVEMPLLSVYNMMNAKEKLEFEVLSGRYITTSGSVSSQIELDQLYNDHKKLVEQGVDTYWLNEPVRTGFSENNSIFAQGGDDSFRYGVGVNYKTQTGAMKGSGRDTWSGNINLTYRKKKININNNLFVRGYKANETPYGSFSNFVNANPYFKKDVTSPYLEQTRTARGTVLRVSNPLYNALLPNINSDNNLEVQNNLQLNYDITSDIRLSGGLQLIKGATESTLFLAPEHSSFEEIPLLRKGKYTRNERDNFSYQANALLTYGKVFAEKHSITANARAEINNREFRALQMIAEGFPEGATGNPRFAYSYQANGAPTASSSVSRSVNATLSANYAYDQRFLLDASYRLDGSTAFGSNRQFSPYWSAGLGWNLHNEALLKNRNWLNRLRVYGNIGVTGNQNYASISSTSTYDYNSNTNYNQFGQGVTLSTYGNPDLAPQKTTQISGGIDFSFFKDRLTGYINVYNKRTNPLVVAVDLASSTGLVAFPFNVGTMNTLGGEIKIGYSPIYKLEDRIVWNLNITGSSYKSKYSGLGSALAGLNTQNQQNQTITTKLLQFNDGYSPDDIWAAKSLGIDPGTGREMFLRPDGQYTYDYNAAILSAVGNTNPVIEGVASTYFSYKGFNAGVNIRYQFGGDIFNTALYNKVENITYASVANNQDRRALYDRWRNPGDVAYFKAISQTSVTPQSSRFVQRNNNITGESISLGYTFDRQAWLKRAGLSTVTLTAIANDIFQVSSVLRERGVDYPFAKTISMSLRASF